MLIKDIQSLLSMTQHLNLRGIVPQLQTFWPRKSFFSESTVKGPGGGKTDEMSLPLALNFSGEADPVKKKKTLLA